MPRPDTENSETGSPEHGWEYVQEIPKTQREAIVALESHLSRISEKTKSSDLRLSEYLKIASSAEQKVKETLEEVEKTKSMVYLGFWALSIIVIGITFSYIEFVYSGSKNDDYKYNLSEKVNNNESEIKILKMCLASNQWFNPKCFAN